ncbi:tyrP-A [Symbiodinium sp. CCMP2592]|nr:tyrP-A [Symbiodinium sp. CCMP2592]
MASLSLQPISLAAAPSSAPATRSGGSRSVAQLRRPQSWYSTNGGPIPATAGSHAVSLFLVLRRKRHRDLAARPRRPQRRFRGPRAASLRGAADPMGPSLSDAQLQRLLSPAFIASFLSFLLYPLFAEAVASQLDSVALGVIKGDVSQYMQNFFNFNSLLFSFFVSQTYASLYQQQESLYMALYSEIAEARSLLEQLTLVSQNRPSYRSMLQSMDAYVEELILGVRVGCPPAVLVSAKPALDPLEAILYATSVGVPSVVYDTVRSLREARGQRLGATQRKLPWEHFVLLNVLGAMELLVFPLLGAGISGYEASDAAAPGHVLWIQSVVFAILAGGVVLALQVIQDLRSPTSGLYSLDSTLDEMVEGLRAELRHRLEAAPASSASRLPSPVGPALRRGRCRKT